MTVKLLLLLILVAWPFFAICEELSIDFPDHEKKLYSVPHDSDFIFKIQSKDWRCSIAKPPEKDQAEKAFTRRIGCFKGQDQLFTVLLCRKGEEYPPVILTLTEDGKKTIMMFACKKILI